MRGKASAGGGPNSKPEASWLAGAAIGLTILGLASSAMMFGVGVAWSQSGRGGK